MPEVNERAQEAVIDDLAWTYDCLEVSPLRDDGSRKVACLNRGRYMHEGPSKGFFSVASYIIDRHGVRRPGEAK